MKEFGYGMLTEPEGVSDVVLDNIKKGTDANHYNTAATVTGIFIDKAIIGKVISNSSVEEVILNSKFSSQLIGSILNDFSKGANDEDKEK